MADGKHDTLGEARARWEETSLRRTLSRFPERQERFDTVSGIEVERLYLPPDDASGQKYQAQLGFPGEYPFTRGVQPTMYRGRLWTMRQYAGFGSAKETNARYRYLLSQGTTGLSVAFDLPTQMGYDSDHAMAKGEVGRAGVAIDSLADFEVLLAEIPLDRVSTSMTINATAAILLSMYLTLCERQGVDPKQIRGTVQNDILKEYIARGTYIYPPKPSMRIISDLIGFARERMPAFNTISISGYHIREAGSTAPQEVAFTLIDGIAYVEAAIRAGLAVDEFAPRLSFFFAAHNNLFEEVAKFRAARRLWARIMKERFGAEKPKSLMLRFHTQTCGHTLTAQQPDVNVVRVAVQALAAVLGGTQSLHTNSKDEALSLPTQEAATLALRTQQVLAYESGVAESVDPLAGSYLVEALTDQIEAEARRYIERVDEMGGAVAAIEQGYPQAEIADAAYRYQREIEAEKRVIVGLNRFDEEAPGKADIFQLDATMEAEQVTRLRELRARRDGVEARGRLDALGQAARGDENLLPYIHAAVGAYCSVGEISDTLREVFGTYEGSN